MSSFEIGDRVIPFESSSLTDMNGEPEYIVFEPFRSTKYWVVISNNERTISNPVTYGCDEYLQDLLIAHPVSKICYRINSDHVRYYNT